ncbi:MAG: thymidine phosphorylase, partial [Armatimonadota bacterium]|nr:thymidine phosphorylase [Armatimonadota bacterium]
MRTVDLIVKKREGSTLSQQEIAFLVGGYMRGDIPDYQMSAWLMAVLWRGLTEPETFALTGAMVASGETLDLSSLPDVPVDKHSTGGVGDKTTLAVVPILASAGVPVAKMSGRGLGHTGGTLDKLASISGLRTELSQEEILAQVRRVGACVCAQTEQLVPADRKMYALRDATGTVESLPLIAASIMSKKIAGGSRAVVLDVKVGGGAFMKTLDEARALAALMVRIGAAHGQRVVAVLSDMNAPLGRSVGNWLEVQEIVGLLQNHPDTEPHLAQIVRRLAALGFVVAGHTPSVEDGETLAVRQIESGAAFEKLCEIAAAQGGDAACLRHPEGMTQAPHQDVLASQSGFVKHIDAQAIGLAAMRLGAGRAAKDDVIDPLAGIV